MVERDDATAAEAADGGPAGEGAADDRADDDGGLLSDRAKTGVLIAAVGVVVPGVADNLLTQWGAPGLGAFVWAIGFGSAVVALWFVLLRPLDIGAETEG